ncbi:hypothetical protein [Immundisolibacter sp.]
MTQPVCRNCRRVSSDKARHVLANPVIVAPFRIAQGPVMTLATVTLATHAACLQPGNIVPQSFGAPKSRGWRLP